MGGCAGALACEQPRKIEKIGNCGGGEKKSESGEREGLSCPSFHFFFPSFKNRNKAVHRLLEHPVTYPKDLTKIKNEVVHEGGILEKIWYPIIKNL